jgi:hypothetical protein
VWRKGRLTTFLAFLLLLTLLLLPLEPPPLLFAHVLFYHIRYWLENEGSPQSRVSNALFKNERRIDIPTYEEFRVRQG